MDVVTQIVGAEKLRAMSGLTQHTEERAHAPIVVVDDDPDAAFLTAELLRRAGVECPIQQIHGGEKLIEQLSSWIEKPGNTELPRILFLDLRMPRVDGFQVLEWMQPHAVLRSMRIVTLSSSIRASDIDRAYALGAHAYLVKFPTPDALVSVVRAAGVEVDVLRPTPARRGGRSASPFKHS